MAEFNLGFHNVLATLMVIWIIEFLSLAPFSGAQVLNFLISIGPCMLILSGILVNSAIGTAREFKLEHGTESMLSFLQLMIVLRSFTCLRTRDSRIMHLALLVLLSKFKGTSNWVLEDWEFEMNGRLRCAKVKSKIKRALSGRENFVDSDYFFSSRRRN